MPLHSERNPKLRHFVGVQPFHQYVCISLHDPFDPMDLAGGIWCTPGAISLSVARYKMFKENGSETVEDLPKSQNGGCPIIWIRLFDWRADGVQWETASPVNSNAYARSDACWVMPRLKKWTCQENNPLGRITSASGAKYWNAYTQEMSLDTNPTSFRARKSREWGEVDLMARHTSTIRLSYLVHRRGVFCVHNRRQNLDQKATIILRRRPQVNT